MNIVIRVDSSVLIGSGHLMRCLTLAEQIKSQMQARIIFISRDLEKNMNYLVEKQGFELYVLPKKTDNNQLTGYEQWLTVTQQEDAEEVNVFLQNQQVDLLIIDSYAIDYKWENIVRPIVKKIMVIDDLANRKHVCDILLDQNYYPDANLRYEGLVPKNCKRLLGLEYVLLREEFYVAKRTLRKRTGAIKNILVFFGGSDPNNETGKTLEALLQLKTNDIAINVVVGASNPHKDSLRLICEENNFNYLCQVSNMAQLIAEADLAIGAGGTAIWERCFLELPTVIVCIADNQEYVLENLCKTYRVYYYVGKSEKIGRNLLSRKIKKVLDNREMYNDMLREIKKIKGIAGKNLGKIISLLNIDKEFN